MKCTPCNSRGLINNDTEICPVCNGIGTIEFFSSVVDVKVEPKPLRAKLKKKISKVLKKITKKK